MGDRAGVGSAGVLSLPLIRRLEVDILLEVRRVCDRLGLTFYLAYGTLWGAVVEQGFLRDDDDIDIVLPRPDYETFLRRFGDLCSPVYRLLSLESCSAYYYSFAKVTDARTNLSELGLPEIPELGISVDVFPLDGMPEGGLRFQVHSLRLGFLHNARYHALRLLSRTVDDGRRRQRLGALGSRISRFLARRYDDLSHSHRLRASRWVSCSVGGRIDGEVFEGWVAVGFEGHSFPAPAGYHRYLSYLYGEYDRRAKALDDEPTHAFLACWRA